mmetsp:Transcript_72669/g.128088  ORF Transcript_72669/g.128088 Transcript_72669/m.128088 type:complete len:205 (+) Transcript_72669:100-714(+)
MRYWTCNRMGRIPSITSRSKSDRNRPARAAFLHMMTGPSWQWSPTSTTCLDPMTIGIRHSGSMACVDSSIRHCLNRKLASRGSAAPTHVVQMTSAAAKMSRSVFLRSCLYFRSSMALSSPWSSFRSCNMASSDFPSISTFAASRFRTWWCRVRKSTDEDTASRLLAHSRTTFSPVRWIFSVSWSTATLEGAATSTCPCPCFTRW